MAVTSADEFPGGGEASLQGSLAASSDRPVVDDGGVVNFAQPEAGSPIGLGSLVSIFGSNLGAAPGIAKVGSWLPELGQTRVYLAGLAIPLGQVSGNRIVGMVPFETPANTTHQLVVQRGNTYSGTKEVAIVNAAPMILTADASGRGQGEIYVETREFGRQLANSGRPARVGERIVILATGLGSTDPVVGVGDPGPSDPIAAVKGKLQVTIEGIEAQVESAGLEPGRVGVFRIVAKVPGETISSSSARVVLTLDGLQSPAVTLAISADSLPQ